MKGRRWELTPKGVKIGRADSCEVLVSDVAAELFHCIVKLVDGKPVVLNLASDNGVVVNGSSVDEAQLKPDDQISVGGECFAITAIGVEKRSSGAQIAAPVVALVLALTAAAFALWRKGQPKSEVAPSPVATNAVAQTAEVAVTTNHVVHVVTEERVVTNRIVRIVDNVMVTNYVVETRRVDEKTGEEIVESNNPYVPPEPTDGLVLSEDGKTLVFVPQGIAHVVIPNGVTTIGDRAFADHKALVSVTIPPSVTKFGRDAFKGCNRLTGVFITDLAAWCQISFTCEEWGMVHDNPLCYARSLYLNGTLVKDLEIPQGVSIVGKNAFRGCSSLTSVTIPRSVVQIGSRAFECKNLVKIVVDGDNRQYKSTDGLLLTRDGRTLVVVPGGIESVTIPAGVVSIGSRSFEGCTKLSKITLPDGVSSIGDWAFCYCHGLTSITIPHSLSRIGEWAFKECDNLADVYISDLAAWCSLSTPWDSAPLNHSFNLYLDGALVKDMAIPNGVTRIRSRVFRGCNSLTSVTIPRSVVRIVPGAFANCCNLLKFDVHVGNRHYKSENGLLLTEDGRSLVAVPGGVRMARIPGGVEVVEDGAFSGCEKLSGVKLPSRLTRIGRYAFAGCSVLDGVELPNGLRHIDEYAFLNCKGLASIVIPGSVKHLGGWVFKDCKRVTDITIPGSLESIHDGAFGWSGLTNVTIQSGVKTIGHSAFKETHLTTLTIPDSVREIGWHAFGYCRGLESVTVPEGLTNIHENAFEGCKRLMDENGRPRLTRVPSTAEKTKSNRSAK